MSEEEQSKYIVVYNDEVRDGFFSIAEAKEFAVEEIQDCYSTGEEYAIYKLVTVASSKVEVDFAKESK
jgi:hypothetical protein